MKQLTIALFFLTPLLVMGNSFELANDTVIYHNNRKIVIDDSNDNITVDIYQVNAEGDTLCNEKYTKVSLLMKRALRKFMIIVL